MEKRQLLVDPLSDVNDSPSPIPFWNRVNGSLNRSEFAVAIDIDHDRVIRTDLFRQEGRIYHC